MPYNYSPQEILTAAIEAHTGEMHVALPGKVLTYYAATQTADIQLMVQNVLFDEDGNKVPETFPVLPQIPIGFPRGGGFIISFPLNVGDFVFCVFSEMSLSEYRNTGQLSIPQDVRRHGLSYPVALPCYYPDTNPATSPITQGTTILIGKDGATQDFAALASKVDSWFSEIQTKFSTHVHTGVTTGPGSSGTTVTTISGAGATGSTTVKVTQ